MEFKIFISLNEILINAKGVLIKIFIINYFSSYSPISRFRLFSLY